MQKVNLYRYEKNGTVTVTPNARRETDIPSRMRLIADEDYILTNGIKEMSVVDVILDEIELWHEIEKIYEIDEDVLN